MVSYLLVYSEKYSFRVEFECDCQDGSEFCPIRGIRIPKGQNPPELPNNIRGLRLLVVEHDINLRSLFGSVVFGDLVWLRLSNCKFISIPSTLSLRCLRVLELQRLRHKDIEEFFNSIDEVSKYKL